MRPLIPGWCCAPLVFAQVGPCLLSGTVAGIRMLECLVCGLQSNQEHREHSVDWNFWVFSVSNWPGRLPHGRRWGENLCWIFWVKRRLQPDWVEQQRPMLLALCSCLRLGPPSPPQDGRGKQLCSLWSESKCAQWTYYRTHSLSTSSTYVHLSTA